jgi:hypothetical protein
VFKNCPVRKYIQSSGCFFPAAGYRNTGGALATVGYDGNACSSSPDDAYAYRLAFNSTSLYPAGNVDRRNGFPVRCVKEFILVCDQTVQKDET